jgi:uncharacterized protein (TIGR03067 family)
MGRVTVLAVGVMFVMLGTQGRGDDKPNAVESFQGEWTVISLSVSNYEIKGTPDHPMKVTFIKDRMVTFPGYEINYTFYLGYDDSGFHNDQSTVITLTEHNQEATLQLDAGTTPGQIDFKMKEGKEIRDRKGIYEMKDDELRLCIGGATRPTEFKATAHELVLILKRKGKKD